MRRVRDVEVGGDTSVLAGPLRAERGGRSMTSKDAYEELADMLCSEEIRVGPRMNHHLANMGLVTAEHWLVGCHLNLKAMSFG